MTASPSTDMHPILGIPIAAMPRHIAITMDGNGRWAQEKGRPRTEGHSSGSQAVRDIITESARLGLECLTLYAFSTENWKRPANEVKHLMGLYAEYLIKERPTIMNNNIRLRHIGDRSGLPDRLLEELDTTAEMSKDNPGMVLSLALNYSGRSELTRAVRAIAQEVTAGTLSPSVIDEQTISDHLDTAGLPDPDLLIRTAGDMRISNFLLWQISYAEFYITKTYWPDFRAADLHTAIVTFAQRNRRFGGLSDPDATADAQ